MEGHPIRGITLGLEVISVKCGFFDLHKFGDEC
jgi:hypothetical protein